MILDIKTLMLLYLIINVISTGAVALLWRQNRGRYAGISFWLADMILQAAGSLLIVLRGLVGDLISMVLANTMIQAGALLMLIGLERFTGKKGWQIHNYVLLAAFMGIFAYYSLVQPDLSTREIVLSAMTMIITFQCCWLLLRRVDPGGLPITRLAGIVFAGYVVFSFIRISLHILFPGQTNDFFKAGAVDALSITVYIVLSACLVISLVVMVNQRLLADVKSQEAALRDSDIRFRELFDHMSSGAAVYEAIDNGGDFIFKDFNPAAEKIEKISAKDILGKRVSEVFPGVKTFGIFGVLQRVWQTGKPEYVPENVYKDDKDSGSWRESWVFKLPGREIVAIYNDITERRRDREELEKSRQELRDLSARLASSREEERKLLGYEIHDEPGQALTALKMDLSWLSKNLTAGQEPLTGKIASMLNLIDTTMKIIKRISTRLRPGMLDDLGLVAALEWQAGEFQERTGIKINLSFEPADIRLDAEQSIALFRIFQELLTNVARHAAATRIDACLREKDGALELSVRDNGKGIKPKMLTDSKSFGLIGMRERCHHLGGTVDIRGKPGKGTTVTVNLPAGEVRQ